VNRLIVHFEYLEFPFAVAGIVAVDKAVGIADFVVADKAVGIADFVVAGKAVGIAGIVAAGIADIFAVGKTVGLAATFCLVELPIPLLMRILITVITLLKFSF
jgi:hypothetical protein